jgi:siroheme synthase (precorrin-2 oxidase/ferrochelatase)
MEYFPIFLDLRGRRCLVVGGGDGAAAKAAQLARAGAAVALVAAAPSQALRDAMRSGAVTISPGNSRRRGSTVRHLSWSRMTRRP